VELRRCFLDQETELHAASGLRTMPAAAPHAGVETAVTHALDLPEALCPVSKNPRAGSRLVISYAPASGRCLEVYHLRALLKRFVGGYPGSDCGTYPAERNMEGTVQLVARMCADALGVPVFARADLVLDAGGQTVVCTAHPRNATAADTDAGAQSAKPGGVCPFALLRSDEARAEAETDAFFARQGAAERTN